ncbi:MAG: cytochrome c oxidase subunit 3 [Bacteroidia bacterium]|nr:cytochrome c oxidase subunit 3 [Bacteroidia bacterium]MDW8157861.1 cytochrome c oxidase subunit 3 [Bacteroidia bacterium]
MQSQIVSNFSPTTTSKFNTQRLLMWLYLGTVAMLFAAFTSALIVSRTDNLARDNWLQFKMPFSFTITTAIILLSSVTLHWAWISAKKDRPSSLNLALALTIVLGILFLTGQVIGYSKLVAMNVYLVGNVSGSFFYVLTAMHGLHLVAGLIALIYITIQAFRLRISSSNLVGLELCSTFWHALGLLWLYLFVFLSYIY